MQRIAANDRSSPRQSLQGWRPGAREVRIFVYLLLASVIVAWKFAPRPWYYTTTIETTHHTIYSTATQEQTRETGHVLEILYTAYSNRFAAFHQLQTNHPKLKVKLFRDRAEFRRINPNLGWAEAFYREPYCNAYFSESEDNPYYWMMHESVHQLNREVTQLKLAKWLEEGLATYFSTGLLGSDALKVEQIDPDTYPVWWIDEIATGPDLAENIRDGTVIPLRAIVTNRGGPSLNDHFNLYYLHWWSLTRFVFDSPQHRDRALELVRRGGSLEAFEQIIGPLDQVQKEWHDYVRNLKADHSSRNTHVTSPSTGL